jgi:hypothetical protein
VVNEKNLLFTFNSWSVVALRSSSGNDIMQEITGPENAKTPLLFSWDFHPAPFLQLSQNSLM